NGDGAPDFTLPGADPLHKDLFVEVDAMAKRGPVPLPPITDVTGDKVPVVITSANNALTTGTRVTVSGVEGNTAANGSFAVTRIDSNHFQLDGATGNGPYTGGGSWALTSLTGTGLATDTILDTVIDAYRRAPVTNPDGHGGINLHVQIDERGVPRKSWDTDRDNDTFTPYG